MYERASFPKGKLVFWGGAARGGRLLVKMTGEKGGGALAPSEIIEKKDFQETSLKTNSLTLLLWKQVL